jgi:hypothetical protein
MFLPMNVIIYFIFLVAFVASSKLSDFGFSKDLQDIKDALNLGGDIRSALASFTRGTRQLYRNDAFKLDQEMVYEYLAIKEEIICLLHNNNDLIDYEIEEIYIFNLFLFQELTRYESYFSQANLHVVLSFLLKASSKNIIKKSKDLAYNLTEKLTPEQLTDFIKFRLAHLKRESFDVEEKIGKLSTTSDPEDIYSTISAVSNSASRIQVSYYESLAEQLNHLNFNVHPYWLVPILDVLKALLSKNIKSTKFYTSVGTFLLNDTIINIMKSSAEFNESYSFLLFFAFKDNEIFSSKFQSVFATFEESSSPHAESLKTIIILYQNIRIISILNNNSTENEFKLVIGAFENLINLKKENYYARQIIAADYLSISSLISDFTNISTNEKHPLFWISLKIVGLIGFLGYDLFDDDKKVIGCYCNIVSGFGHFLLEIGVDSSDHFFKYIEDFRPFMAKALEATILRMMNIGTILGKRTFMAIIRFAELIPNVTDRLGCIDRLYSYYLSDIIPQFNKYDAIKDRELNDKHGVYMSSFLTFLASYTNNPTESQLPYLREYFLFLKDSNLLNKTELMILENIFNGFKHRRFIRR